MSSDASHTHHAIDYIELQATDLAAATRFYSRAFGWKFVEYGPAYAGIQGQDREQGGIALSETVTRGGPLVILFSSDLTATHRSVLEAGGTISKEIFEFPGGRCFHFLDPSGNELGVWANK
jgi:uncharacterized protein